MEDNKILESVAKLFMEPVFVLVPQDRYEELVRAEMQRDMVFTLSESDKSYQLSELIKLMRASMYGELLKEEIPNA